MNGYHVTARINVNADSVRDAVDAVEKLRQIHGGPGPSVEHVVVTSVMQVSKNVRRPDEYVGPYGSGGPGPYE